MKHQNKIQKTRKTTYHWKNWLGRNQPTLRMCLNQSVTKNTSWKEMKYYEQSKRKLSQRNLHQKERMSRQWQVRSQRSHDPWFGGHHKTASDEWCKRRGKQAKTWWHHWRTKWEGRATTTQTAAWFCETPQPSEHFKRSWRCANVCTAAAWQWGRERRLWWFKGNMGEWHRLPSKHRTNFWGS